MMILVSIVQMFRVALVGIREVIAIAPLNRWSRHITAYNKCMARGQSKFAQRAVTRLRAIFIISTQKSRVVLITMAEQTSPYIGRWSTARPYGEPL